MRSRTTLVVLLLGMASWNCVYTLASKEVSSQAGLTLSEETSVTDNNWQTPDQVTEVDGTQGPTQGQVQQTVIELINDVTTDNGVTPTVPQEKKEGLSKTTVIALSTCIPLAFIGMGASVVLVFITRRRQIWCFKKKDEDNTVTNEIKVDTAIARLRNLLTVDRDVLTQQYTSLEKNNLCKTPRPSSRHDTSKRFKVQGNEFLLSDAVFLKDKESYMKSVWDNNVCFIVMLTRLEKHGQSMCGQYWPGPQEVVTWEGLNVRMVSEEKYPNYVHRKLVATWVPRSREIHHYQYTSWHLEECPDDSKQLLDFISLVRSKIDIHPNPGPIVVHCSQDFSRTGTYLVLDQTLQEIQAQKSSFSVYDNLLKLKAEFPSLVIRKPQYVFIHECLKAYLDLNFAHYDNVHMPGQANPYHVSVIPVPLKDEDPYNGRGQPPAGPRLPPRDYRGLPGYRSPPAEEPAMYEDMRPVVKMVHQRAMARDQRGGRRVAKDGDESETDEGVYGGSDSSGPGMRTVRNQWI